MSLFERISEVRRALAREFLRPEAPAITDAAWALDRLLGESGAIAVGAPNPKFLAEVGCGSCQPTPTEEARIRLLLNVTVTMYGKSGPQIRQWFRTEREDLGGYNPTNAIRLGSADVIEAVMKAARRFAAE